jgi:hypothetical protein
MKRTFGPRLLPAILFFAHFSSQQVTGADANHSGYSAEETQTISILFIGNSFTQRNSLTEVVKTLFEQGNPGMTLDVYTQTYGGRSLEEHWKLGTQNFIKQSLLTAQEEQEMITKIENEISKDPDNKDPFTSYYKLALPRHRELLTNINNKTVKKWDIVVLQSWQDDRTGADSPYLTYAPMFAGATAAQGGKVILYETTPSTQNARPLTSPPTNRTSVMDKEKYIAELGRNLNAMVVPMALTAYNCQLTRPDFTLRYIDDFHPNQTMTYLTACTFYAVLSNRSPEGLPLDRVRASVYLDENNKQLDQNGDPIVKIFSTADKEDLQRIAWESVNEFKETFVGVERISVDQGISAFPNPARETLNVSLKEADSNCFLGLRILRTDGKLAYSADNLDPELKEISLSLSGLAPSVYFIHAETLKGTYTTKFSVTHVNNILR